MTLKCELAGLSAGRKEGSLGTKGDTNAGELVMALFELAGEWLCRVWPRVLNGQ